MSEKRAAALKEKSSSPERKEQRLRKTASGKNIIPEKTVPAERSRREQNPPGQLEKRILPVL